MKIVEVKQAKDYTLAGGLRTTFDADRVVFVEEIPALHSRNVGMVAIRLPNSHTVYTSESYEEVLRKIGWKGEG